MIAYNQHIAHARLWGQLALTPATQLLFHCVTALLARLITSSLEAASMRNPEDIGSGLVYSWVYL